MDDIFDIGILSDSCQSNCNCNKQYESSDSANKKDKSGGAPK